MGLKRRLRVLEGDLLRGPCPDCGEYSINDASVKHEVEVEWIDDENDPRMPEEPTICPTCGEPDFIVIGWGDEPDGD